MDTPAWAVAPKACDCQLAQGAELWRPIHSEQ